MSVNAALRLCLIMSDQESPSRLKASTAKLPTLGHRRDGPSLGAGVCERDPAAAERWWLQAAEAGHGHRALFVGLLMIERKQLAQTEDGFEGRPMLESPTP
jgi:hypothetical protein